MLRNAELLDTLRGGMYTLAAKQLMIAAQAPSQFTARDDNGDKHATKAVITGYPHQEKAFALILCARLIDQIL